MRKELPNSDFVPYIAFGTTDLRFLREKGVEAYGFALIDPSIPTKNFTDLIHGVDERVSVKTVELSQNAYYNLERTFLAI